MNYEKRIRNIKADIVQRRDTHYTLHGFVPIKKKYQSRKKRENDSNYNLKQLCKHLKLKEPEVFNQQDVNILEDDIFHPINNDEEERVIWKELDNEARVEYIENYFSYAEFDPTVKEETQCEIIELLQNGKLVRKSDILFDEVNCKVVCIKVLKYDEDKDEYYINLQQVDKRKQRNKRLKRFFS